MYKITRTGDRVCTDSDKQCESTNLTVRDKNLFSQGHAAITQTHANEAMPDGGS